MSYRVNRRVEHKRHNYYLEYRLSSGETELGKRVRCHRSEYKVTECTAKGNENSIEYVP